MHHFDIVVIGNGILGHSVVFALLQENPRLKIGIVGPTQRIGDASSAAGAMLGCFGEANKHTLTSSYHRAKFDISLQAAKLWPTWLAHLNELIEPHLRQEIRFGTFVILNAKSGILDDENYTAVRNCLQYYQENFEEVNPSNIPGLNPIEDCRPIEAMYLPTEGSINPQKLLAGFEVIDLIFPNLTEVEGNVKQIQTSHNKIEWVETENGERLAGDHYVLTAGAHSQYLIDQIPEICDLIPRLFYGAGTSAVIESDQTNSSKAIPHVIRTPNRSFGCGLHIVPKDDDSFYVGATNNLCLLPEHAARIGSLHFLLQCVIEQINQSFHNYRMVKVQAGNRPVTIDTFPLIGATSIPGLWLLTGTYRDGLHQSPILAQYLAKQILHGEEIFKNYFSPERKPIQTLSVQESINEFVTHYISGGYEHAIKLPRVGWDQLFKEMVRNKGELIYQHLDSGNTSLPPEFLFSFDEGYNEKLAFFKAYLNKLENNTYKNHHSESFSLCEV